MNDSPRPPLSLHPRFHNALSYSVTAIVFAALADWSHAPTQLAGALWTLHFLRRTAESLWVHRYSGRPVPVGDWLVEYVYYWGFAAWIAIGLKGAALPGTWQVGLAIFSVGELGNTWAHQKLRALRGTSGVAERKIPQGGVFALVSCPHYLFEITSWVGFALLTQVLGAYCFLALGSGILGFYAWTRHQAYREEFNGQDGQPAYPASRKALIPGLF